MFDRMTTSTSRSSSGDAHDIIVGDGSPAQNASASSLGLATASPKAEVAIEPPPFHSKSRIHVTKSITRESTLDDMETHHGSSHTTFEVLPVNDENSSTYATSPSTPRMQLDDSFENIDPNDPPLLTSTLSSITQQPLDDYREPEAVPDENVPPLYATDWGASGSDNGGWAPWGETSPQTLYPFITTEEEDVDSEFMPPVKDWWSLSFQTLTSSRPGPGFLPPRLEQVLDLESLYLVNVTDVPSLEGVPEGVSPVTLDEVQNCMPGHMYFAPRQQGWRYIRHLEDPSLSLLHTTPDRPLPATHIRSRRVDCAHPDANLHKLAKEVTHHYHLYPSSVDSSDLPDSPLRHLARLPTSSLAEVSVSSDQMDEDQTTSIAYETPNGYLLDVYACALCHVYIVASPMIPAIIPRDKHEALSNRLRENPPAGITPVGSMVRAWELIIR